MSQADDNGRKRLFKVHSAIRQFIFNRCQKHGGPDQVRSTPQAPTPVPPCGPAASGKAAYLHAALQRLKQCDRFCALAVAWDAADDNAGLPSIRRAAGALAAPVEYVWGELAHDIAGCCLPGADPAAALALVDRLRERIRAAGNGTVSTGIAVYPMLAFDKEAVLLNAGKALAHAVLLGKDSVAVFDAVSLNVNADALYQKGDVAGAARELELARQLDPGDVNVLNSLGVCYGASGRLAEALAVFEEAARRDRQDVMALHNAGYACYLNGNREKALGYFHQAEKLDGNVFEVIFHLGRLYLERGETHKAKHFLDKALRIRPDSGLVYNCLGAHHVEDGDTRKAVNCFEKAVKKNPNDAEALSMLAVLYDRIGENPEIAVVFSEKSVEIEPEEAVYHTRLGEIYRTRQRYRDALVAFENAARLGHDVTEAMNAIRGVMRRGSGTKPDRK